MLKFRRGGLKMLEKRVQVIIRQRSKGKWSEWRNLSKLARSQLVSSWIISANTRKERKLFVARLNLNTQILCLKLKLSSIRTNILPSTNQKPRSQLLILFSFSSPLMPLEFITCVCLKFLHFSLSQGSSLWSKPHNLLSGLLQ